MTVFRHQKIALDMSHYAAYIGFISSGNHAGLNPMDDKMFYVAIRTQSNVEVFRGKTMKAAFVRAIDSLGGHHAVKSGVQSTFSGKARLTADDGIKFWGSLMQDMFFKNDNDDYGFGETEAEAVAMAAAMVAGDEEE